jgi:hypothetical protein
LLRRGVVILADRMWRENSSGATKAAPFEAMRRDGSILCETPGPFAKE